MRTLPGVLLLLTLLVAGCGSEGSGGAGVDEPPEPTAGAQGEPSDDAPEVLTLVAQSRAGGQVDPVAVSVDGRAALGEFAARFDDQRMGEALEKALAETRLPAGRVPAAAVVAIECESPSDVDIEVTDNGVEVTADPVKSEIQCLVPVTTVALIAADPADL